LQVAAALSSPAGDWPVRSLMRCTSKRSLTVVHREPGADHRGQFAWDYWDPAVATIATNGAI
jgi:hypothetical protein